MEIGIKQVLYAVKKTNLGVFVNDEPDKPAGSILVKSSELKKDLAIGDQVEAFVYLNQQNELAAVLEAPPVQRGEIGFLKVKELTRIGAFLDLGLDKDVLLPFSEQKGELKLQQEILVGLYLDKSKRLCATMDIAKTLRSDAPYKEDDIVEGMVYQVHPELGAFVAVDRKYHGLILSHDLAEPLHRGAQVRCRVAKVRPDGRMNLTLKEKPSVQTDKDAQKVLGRLILSGGYLPYHDKTPAAVIEKEFHLSKKAFKRAIGKMYKDHRILIEDKGIRLVQQDEDEYEE